MTTVLIAPDKFKGTLTAEQVATHLATGVSAAAPGVVIVQIPVADGGDGTLAAAVAAGFSLVPMTASGPTGLPVQTAYARRDDAAVVELAEVSGLSLLPGGRPSPLTATSHGTGQLVAAALDAGCREVILAIGGSACTDGGAGLLQALGIRVNAADGEPVQFGGAALSQAVEVDLSRMHPGLADADIVVACDVDNPLLGPHGAAAVYGPQKGAGPEQVVQLEAGLARWAELVAAAMGFDHSRAPGAGAAGGVGFAALAVLGAQLRPGIDLLLELTGFHEALKDARLVITGEGSIDAQTLHGKAPAGVAAAARAAGVPVVAVAGRCLLGEAELRAAGFAAAYPLTDEGADLQECMDNPGPLLERIGARIGRDHLRALGPDGSAQLDLVFRARRVITAAGEVARCVGVRGGRIVAIEPLDSGLTGAEMVELGDDVVLLPGLVDSHVHVNEPGRTQWEGFASATKAAAAGGVTTIIDMPLNSIPPTVDVTALELKRQAARDQAYVDVGFWGGAVPANLGDLRGLHDAGVFGFKCFLLPSGVDEFPHLEPEDLEKALREVDSFGALMIVHAEDAHTIEHASNPATAAISRDIDQAGAPNGRSYDDFLASRPREAENLAVARVIELARRTGCRVHILHLSSADALPMIASARRDGVPLTVETCPHYLSFDAEEIPDGATQFKCCPPIREAANRGLLWQGLADGVIDCVVSDHSPCTVELKAFDSGDFRVAWGGIASLQLGLPAVWTQARRRGHTLIDVVRWMAENPAKQAGLLTKGHIALGYAADFAVLAPDETFVVDVARLHHKNPVSAYSGRTLDGVVRSTWLAGRQVIIDEEPRGRLVERGMA